MKSLFSRTENSMKFQKSAFFFLLFASQSFAAPTARQLLEKSEEHMQGKSFSGVVQMEVERPGSMRRLKMRLWSKERTSSLVKIMEPSKDLNTGNLRLDMNLWQYLPNVDRLIRIPSSMMLQSWMGSDLTNDDLVKVSSLARDYEAKIDGVEKVNGEDAVRIVCIPKATAPVVWGKVIAWVRRSDAAPLKKAFYSEKEKLLKVFTGSNIKNFGGHVIPTKWVMENANKTGSFTRIEYSDVTFDTPLSDDLFTQQNLRKPIR
jgi:outer membrane lipoprotein-sorting protein